METGFKYAIAPGRSLPPKTVGSTAGAGNTVAGDVFSWIVVSSDFAWGLSVLCTGTVFCSIPVFLCVYTKNRWEVASFSSPCGTQAFATWVGLEVLQLPLHGTGSFKDPVETLTCHFPRLSHFIRILSLTWMPVTPLSFLSSSIWACCYVLPLHSSYSSSPTPSRLCGKCWVVCSRFGAKRKNTLQPKVAHNSEGHIKNHWAKK